MVQPKSIIQQIHQISLRYPDKIMLRYEEGGEYKTLTYGQAFDLIEKVFWGLHTLGLGGKKIAMIAENSYRWILTDLAIQATGGCNVPRGADATLEEIDYIIKHSGAAAVVADTRKTVQNLRKIKLGTKPVIVLEYNLKASRGKERSFDQLVALGEKALKNKRNAGKFKLRIDRVKPTDLLTLIYTSGTTGRPKGVMLLHQNVLHNTLNIIPRLPFDTEDLGLSILPIWHVYERTCEYYFFSRGGSLAYTSKASILKDMAYYRPTYFPSVPTVWLNIHNKIHRNIKQKSVIARGMFAFFKFIGITYVWATRLSEDRFFRTTATEKKSRIKMAFGSTLRALLIVPKILGHLIIFRKIVALTGGRLKNCVSGGGALPPHVEDFFEAAGIPLVVGYGITETAPVVSVMDPNHKIFATLGLPLDGVQWKVTDEKGRDLPDGQQGVIQIKGDLVMKGYYKDPKRTASVIKKGWYNSGDLGVRGAYNHIQFVGREKDTIVLISGENIEPLPIEDTILVADLIEDIMVVGQDRKFLTALAVIDNDEAVARLKKMYMNVSPPRMFDLPVLKELVMEEIRKRVNQNSRFHTYEKIHDVTILREAFKPGETLTLSLKKKRNVIIQKFRKEIDRMYGGSGE